MNNRVKKHIGYYVSLISILGIGVVLTLQASYDKNLQILIVAFTAFCYSIWGIIHHTVHHDLTGKIVVEYILMAALGVSAVLFLLKGGLLG